MAKVTVWLTSYNHGKYLKESIESVLEQTYTDYELIIVDDYSTDGSREIIEEYATKYSGIRTIFHEKNWGYSGLKKSLNMIDSDYLAVLHGDDIWKKDKLKKQIAILETQEDIAACFTGVQVIDAKGQIKENHIYSKVFKVENRSRYEWLRYFFDNGNCLCHPSLLIRTNAYNEYDLFTSGLNSLPDFEEWIKLCMKKNIYIIPENLMLFRVHADESNASGDTEEKQKRMFSEEFFVYRKYFDINDKETLVKVFPECKKYIIDDRCVVKFALAKMFLESSRNSQKLLGLECLYELFQNKVQKQEVYELYKYGEKEFNLDKQKYDIFGNIPRDKYMITTLFWSLGDGYTEEACIKKNVYIPNTGVVRLIYNIPMLNDIQSLRLDIDEGIWRQCTVLKAKWENGENVNIQAINAEKQEEIDFFYTVDPQYSVEINKDCYLLEVMLKIDTISPDEVEKYYNTKINKMQEIINHPFKNQMDKFKRILK